jgi:hypothetical protein
MPVGNVLSCLVLHLAGVVRVSRWMEIRLSGYLHFYCIRGNPSCNVTNVTFVLRRSVGLRMVRERSGAGKQLALCHSPGWRPAKLAA